MESSLQIRQMTDRDYDDLIMLWERADLPYRPRGRDSRQNLLRERKLNPDLHLVVMDGEHLAGSVVCSFEGRKGWINRLAVDPEYRGQGLGMELLRRAEEALRQRGATVLCCLIERDNHASIAMFEKSGYTTHPDVLYFTKRENPDS